jgi:hypothetical protein
MEDDDECQYSISELVEKMKLLSPGQDTYSEKHIRRLLCARFGAVIVIAEIPGKSIIVTFTHINHKILNDK